MTTEIPTLRPDAQALVDAWGPLFVYNNDFCFPDYRAVCLSPPERQVGGWYAYFYDPIERSMGKWEGRSGMAPDLSDAIVEAWTQKPREAPPIKPPCPACNGTGWLPIWWERPDGMGALTGAHPGPPGPLKRNDPCPMCQCSDPWSATQLATNYMMLMDAYDRYKARNKRLEDRLYGLRDTIRSLKRGRGRNRVRDWKVVERMVLR